MITIKNNIIPFEGYLAMCVFPFVFVREDARNVTEVDINHEMIHCKQQIEMLWVLFFVWYCIEWFVRWVAYGFDGHLAYRNISFEREAYANQSNITYLDERKPYAFIKYLTKNN